MPATTYGWPTSAGANSSICAVAATGPPWSMTSSLGASRAPTASASGSTSRSRSPNGSCVGTPVAPSTTSGTWRRVKASGGWRTARLRSGAVPGAGGPICPSICVVANGTPGWPASGPRARFKSAERVRSAPAPSVACPICAGSARPDSASGPSTSASRWTVMEIYPRLLTGPVHKSSREHRARYLGDSAWPVAPASATHIVHSEDAFDAAISALVMDRHRERIDAPRTDLRPGRPARGRRLATLLLTSPE